MQLEPGTEICGGIRIDGHAPGGCPAFARPLAGRLKSGRRVWLTVVPRVRLPGSVDVSRFMASMASLASWRSPGLMRVVDVDREPDFCVVAYEAVSGGIQLSSAQHAGRSVEVAATLARGLEQLHDHGVLHGALCSASVVVTGSAVRTWQYGIAGLLALDPDTAKIPLAPETAGGKRADEAADVYAWGATMAALMTGETGHAAIAAVVSREVARSHKPGLVDLVRRALSADARRRPPDGVDLLAALDDESADPPLEADPEPVLELEPDAAEPSQPRIEVRQAAGDERHKPAAVDPSPEIEPVPRGGRRMPQPRAELGERIELARPVGRGASTPDWMRQPALPGGLDLEPELAPAPGQAPDDDPLSLDSGVPRMVRSFPTPVPIARPAPRTPPSQPQRASAWRSTGLALLAALAAVGLGALTIYAAARYERETAAAPAPTVLPPVEEAPPPTVPIVQPAAALTPTTCPNEMVPVGAGSCIERGEYPGLREIPAVDVDLETARRLCAARGRRLCTAPQWLRACRGEARRRYPYGGGLQRDRCNTASPTGIVSDLSRSGARDECVTPDGIYDLVGNVSEWVDDGTARGGDAMHSRASCTTKVRPRGGRGGPARGLRCCLTLAEVAGD